LAPGVIVFPSVEMQEKAHTLSHFDLVLSQILGEMLQGLQASIVQELNLHTKKTSDELAKATTRLQACRLTTTELNGKGMQLRRRKNR
jgi:hypothetical protein